MRQAAIFVLILVLGGSAVIPARAQDRDDFLRVYAIKVIHNRPFKEPFVGFGVYFGRGVVLTAAHVLGRFPSFMTNPRILIGGKELEAKVLKKGSFTTIDLAVLAVDERQLPASYQLRRNPLCKHTPSAGEHVIVVLPHMIARSQIVFPEEIPPEYRATSNTFIDDVAIPGGSGTGVFDNERKCLLGIMSAKLADHSFRLADGRMVRDLSRSTVGIARIFVPAAVIAEFIPAEYRF